VPVLAARRVRDVPRQRAALPAGAPGDGRVRRPLEVGGKCDDGDDAGEDAFSQRREVFFYARSKGGAAKKLCNHKDDVDADPCKNNVECRFLEGVAKKFPTVVTLTNCTTMVEPPARNA
jgi:hypothetical protein